jgi:type II secretory pathway pseudopilin PulG
MRMTGLKTSLESKNQGYVLLLVLLALFILTLGLMVAMPVLETQLKRENEEELIFRGLQYVEAIRLYQQKKPGTFPSSLEELLKEKCLRKLYPDPMSKDGKWNLLLLPTSLTPGPRATGPAPAAESTTEKLLVVSSAALKKIKNPQIVGVVSSSQEKSVKIYQEAEYYHQWLFYYGQMPGKKPQLIYQQE